MLEAIQSMDGAILLWIQEFVRMEWLDPIVLQFTSLGNAGIVWIVAAVLMLCRKSTRKLGFYTGLALIFSLLLTNLGLKPLISRERPYFVVEGLEALVRSSDPNSFPSGHTSAAFAAGIVWAGMLPKRWLKVLAVAQAVLMGLSRLYVGVHFPSDVLVGACVGTLCAVLALTVRKYADCGAFRRR